MILYLDFYFLYRLNLCVDSWCPGPGSVVISVFRFLPPVGTIKIVFYSFLSPCCSYEATFQPATPDGPTTSQEVLQRGALFVLRGWSYACDSTRPHCISLLPCQVLGPCHRCQMICIDQKTGQRNQDVFQKLSESRGRKVGMRAQRGSPILRFWHALGTELF